MGRALLHLQVLSLPTDHGMTPRYPTVSCVGIFFKCLGSFAFSLGIFFFCLSRFRSCAGVFFSCLMEVLSCVGNLFACVECCIACLGSFIACLDTSVSSLHFLLVASRHKSAVAHKEIRNSAATAPFQCMRSRTLCVPKR